MITQFSFWPLRTTRIFYSSKRNTRPMWLCTLQLCVLALFKLSMRHSTYHRVVSLRSWQFSLLTDDEEEANETKWRTWSSSASPAMCGPISRIRSHWSRHYTASHGSQRCVSLKHSTSTISSVCKKYAHFRPSLSLSCIENWCGEIPVTFSPI